MMSEDFTKISDSPERRKDRIVWIDVESTGIEPDREHLLQVASIVTDGNLHELDEGTVVVIHYDDDEVRRMRDECTPFVREMHDRTGLWSRLPDGDPLPEAEKKILRYISAHVSPDDRPRLGGNSITLDRNFLNRYMPEVLERLHYRSYDMTSVSGFVSMFTECPQFEKRKVHDALDDIRESIGEARHYAAFLENSEQRPW